MLQPFQCCRSNGGGGARIHLFSDSYVVASCYDHFSAADLMGDVCVWGVGGGGGGGGLWFRIWTAWENGLRQCRHEEKCRLKDAFMRSHTQLKIRGSIW